MTSDRLSSIGGIARLVAVLVIGGLVALFPLVGAGFPAHGGAGWASDGSRWSGTGSVFVPGSGHVGTRPNDPSGCDGCRWHVVPVCEKNTSEVPCSGTPWLRCPNDAERYYVLFAASASAALSMVAAPCIGPGSKPVSTAEMGRAVAERINSAPPGLRPTYQPKSGALTQLPTIFRSNQPAEVRREDSIAGFSTKMVARARWQWFWGDGKTLTTTKPGGRWPDRSVRHTYRTPGTVEVRVRTTWEAQYWVDGAGPFRVDGETLRQNAKLALVVREARAVLTE
ncbi:MAG: hypothetical protein Q8P61_05880 [Candidatus Nanopelagicales bacterium]|nr:hypothetical protein [Candidatus Nanopelagicales bacterium]